MISSMHSSRAVRPLPSCFSFPFLVFISIFSSCLTPFVPVFSTFWRVAGGAPHVAVLALGGLVEGYGFIVLFV